MTTTKRTLEEKIKALDEKSQKYSNQAKILKAKKVEQERKERTRRLIQIGAIVENLMEREINDFEKFKDEFKAFKNFSNELNAE